AWASTSVPSLLAAGQAAVRWRGEIRTSRGRQASRARKLYKSGEFRTERGEVGAAAESRNDPQEPNLTRESGTVPARDLVGWLTEQRPRLSGFGALGPTRRVRHRVRCTSCEGSSPRASARRWPSAPVGAYGHVARASKGKCERGIREASLSGVFWQVPARPSKSSESDGRTVSWASLAPWS